MSPEKVIQHYCTEAKTLAWIAKSTNMTIGDVEDIISKATHGKYGPQLQWKMFMHTLSLRDRNFTFKTKELVILHIQIGANPKLVGSILDISETTARSRLKDLNHFYWIKVFQMESARKYQTLKDGIPAMYSDHGRMMRILVQFVVFKQTHEYIRSDMGLLPSRLDNFIADANNGLAGREIQELFRKELQRRTHDTRTPKEVMLSEYTLPTPADVLVSTVVRPASLPLQVTTVVHPASLPLQVTPVVRVSPMRPLATLPAALVEESRSPSPAVPGEITAQWVDKSETVSVTSVSRAQTRSRSSSPSVLPPSDSVPWASELPVDWDARSMDDSTDWEEAVRGLPRQRI